MRGAAAVSGSEGCRAVRGAAAVSGSEGCRAVRGAAAVSGSEGCRAVRGAAAVSGSEGCRGVRDAAGVRVAVGWAPQGEGSASWGRWGGMVRGLSGANRPQALGSTLRESTIGRPRRPADLPPSHGDPRGC